MSNMNKGTEAGSRLRKEPVDYGDAALSWDGVGHDTNPVNHGDPLKDLIRKMVS
jgi:hypothetical protein